MTNNTDKLKEDTKVFIDSLGGMGSADSKREEFLLGVLSDTYYKMILAQLQFKQALDQVVWPEEIAELTKQRDELVQELTTIKRMANICGGEIDELELTMHQICTIASEALSTQEANKDG